MRMQPREDSSFVFDRPVTHDHPSYIERKDELESLNSAVERGKLVFLQGAIGSGKTSLLYEFERQQLAHGGRTACVIRIDCDRGHDQLRINASARSSLIAGSVATVDGFWRLTLRSLSHGVWMFLSRLEQRDREISGPIPEHLLNRYENSKRLAKQISESIREIEKGKELSDGLKELASVIRYFPYPIILVFDDIDVIVHPKGIWRRDLNLLLSDLSSLYVSSTVVPGSDPRIRYVFCSFVPLSELIGRIWPEPQRPEDSRTEKRPKSLLSKRRDVEYWESSMSEFEAGALPDGTREFLNLPSETVFVGSFDVEQIADSLLGSRKHSLPSFVARWIWQESGGIPLLAQVLCHHVLRQWDERMGWFDLMNLVRDTQPVQGLVNRLYRSLTEPQLMLLRIAHGTANRRLQEMVRQAERKIGRLPKSVYTRRRMLFLNLGWRRHVCRSVFDSLLERGVVFREATSDELEASLPYLVQIPDSQSQYVVQSRLIWNALRSRLIAPPLRLCLKQSSIGIWETLSDSVSQVSWDQLLLLGASVYFGVWAFLQLVDRKGPTEAASDAVSIAIPLWAILGLVYVVVKILRKKD